MNLPDLSFSDLTPYYNDAAIIRETVAQINKDFLTHGEEIEFPGEEENAYVEVKEQIMEIVYRLLRVNAQNMVNILYRIDLHERDIQKAFETQEEEGTEGVLAHMIIERELKKVLIRHYFKQKNQG